ncbi:MAG: hypothetical protein ABSH13_14245 [Candidatus Acidiferrum sp.]|jgi:hypothetical protein
MMLNDDDRAKLRFELANANLQSVSRAQGIYLTALLVYICLVWAMYVMGTATVHMESLELKMDAVWQISPFVIMVLTLAVVGTLNATASAYRELREAGSAIFGPDFGSLFAIDTYKNVIDYLALLQILPWGRTRNPTDSHGDQPLLLRLHHLILPGLFAISFATSYWSVRQASFRPQLRFFLVFGWVCLFIQLIFSARPFYRWGVRLFGAKRTNDAYN